MREGLITNRGRGGSTYRAQGFWQGAGALGSESYVSARPDATVVEFRGGLNNPDALPLHIDNLIEELPSVGYWDTALATPDNSGLLNTWQGTHFLATTERYKNVAKHLQFAGTAGNLATIPDSATLDLTSLDIRCLITPDRWRTVAGTLNQVIVSKRDASSGYEFKITDSAASIGRLTFTTNNGTQIATSAPLPFLNYETAWVRVTHIAGSTKFYIAPHISGETEPTTAQWIKWGATATNVITAITANAISFAMGAQPAGTLPFTGSLHVVNVYNAVGAVFNASQHIVNFQAVRDLASGSSPFTTPRPVLGTTWTVTLAGAATIENAGAGGGGVGDYRFAVSDTSRNWTYETIPDEGGDKPEGGWIAWARVDTTTMGTIPDTGQIMLMGVKDGMNVAHLSGGAGYGLPGWAVYMNSARNTWLEVFNGTITDTTATGTQLGSSGSIAVTAPTSTDVLIVVIGNLDNRYQVHAYDLAASRALTSSSITSWGLPTANVDWMYTPRFRFHDPESGVLPMSGVGYMRVPYTDFNSVADYLSRLIDGILDEGTYVAGDAFVSNTSGVFQGDIINSGDLLVADNTSDTPTWTKIERSVTPTWPQRSGSRDGGFISAPNMIDPIVVPESSDFTIWAVVTCDTGVVPLDFLQFCGFSSDSASGYLDSGIYENAGDLYFYAYMDNDLGDSFIDLDDIVLAGDMNFQDCTEPHFIALTIDKANQEVTAYVDNNSVTTPIVNDGSFTWDYIGDGGWINFPSNDVQCITLWGCGAAFRHYPPVAMGTLQASALNYLRTRTGEPSEGFDGEFGLDPFGEGPFGG